MKKSIIISILLAGFFISAYCQAPYNFNYQAVARDISGDVLSNTPVKLKISILKTNVSGQAAYSETHLLTTNNFGLINLEIGKGNEKSGSFEAIKWGLDKHFIKIEMDKNGGNNFKVLGTSQLLSVPYSLFSGNGVQYNMSLTCNETTEGMIRYNNEKKTMEFCDGAAWNSFGNSGSNPTCGEDFIDPRDGQVYPTVKIGSQCWMAKNLNFGIYKESVFTNDDHSDVKNNGTVEKYAYDNTENNFNVYGGLYDWQEMMNYNFTEGSQGICPDGWHVPSYDEYVELVETIGGWNDAGKILKMDGSSGFDFLMGGSRTAKGGFAGIGTSGSLWTSTFSTSHPDTRAWNVYFIQNGDNGAKATDLMAVGKSVRCIK